MQGESKTRRLTLMALLTAVALIIFTVEAQLPPLAPIPGIKLGLANIITVYAMFRLGPRDALCILLCRIFMGSIFSGQMMTLFFSLSGGLLCWLVMLGMRKLVTEDQIWLCSAVGAVAHNVGQVLAAMWISGTASMIVYLPVLLVSGVLAGLFTGFCAQFLLKRLKKTPGEQPNSKP